MSFEYDVFISYAHLDDRSPTGEERGWIDLLYQRLSVMLSQQLGEEVKVWRDERSLQGNDELDGAISAGVERALLLVSIFSPRYVKSDWCQRELRAFHEAATRGETSAAGPAFRRRIFKVRKTPLLEPQRKLEPDFVANLTGYEFYGEDEATGALVEFGTGTDDKRYWKELTRLVSHMTKALIDLKYSAPPPPPQENVNTAPPSSTSPASTPAANVVEKSADAASSSKLVYVAQTTSDLKAETQAVRDELTQRGHRVLPEEVLPLEATYEELSAVVRRDLARCALSVHLVGARYGSTPEDDGRSIVQIQEELAAEREKAEPTFQRILWTPAGLGAAGGVEVTDARQREFVAGLQQRVTARAELLQASVEGLKTRVVEKLNPPSASSVAAPTGGPRRSRLKHVYLICEPRDRALVRPIRDYLFKHKFEVITLFDEGADAKLTDYHRKNLKECDAALIYFGNADEPWVRKNLEDLEKAYGYGREDDWAASAVYVGQPVKDEKEDFLTHMAPVIREVKGFNPEDLNEFVKSVEQAEDGEGEG